MVPTSPRTTHMGGKQAGQAMIDAIGGKGNVAIIDHPEVEFGHAADKGVPRGGQGSKGN